MKSESRGQVEREPMSTLRYQIQRRYMLARVFFIPLSENHNQIRPDDLLYMQAVYNDNI